MVTPIIKKTATGILKDSKQADELLEEAGDLIKRS